MRNPITFIRERRAARRWAAFKERSGLTDERAAEIAANMRTACLASLSSAADAQRAMARLSERLHAE